MHRLMSGGRQVDNRQTAMYERDSGFGIEPYVVIVRAAMRETEIHRSCDSFDLIGGLSLRRVSDKAGNATHLLLTLGSQRIDEVHRAVVSAVQSATC
jgi:hypothetical protein